MDHWNEQFGALAQSLDTFGAALEGHHCASAEIIGIAGVVQFELNQHFGCGNRYTAALVRLVGHAIPHFETDVPASIMRDMAALMRLAVEAPVAQKAAQV